METSEEGLLRWDGRTMGEQPGPQMLKLARTRRMFVESQAEYAESLKNQIALYEQLEKVMYEATFSRS